MKMIIDFGIGVSVEQRKESTSIYNFHGGEIVITKKGNRYNLIKSNGGI